MPIHPLLFCYFIVLFLTLRTIPPLPQALHLHSSNAIQLLFQPNPFAAKITSNLIANRSHR